MTEQQSLGVRAFEHIRVLSEHIGPRPAGTEAEHRALDYVTEQLNAWGYTPERLAASFAPLPRFFPLYALAGLALAVGSWGVRAYPWGAIWLPLVLFATPSLARWAIRRRPHSALSENVIAYTHAQAEAPTLILCAHIDSARASAFRNHLWLWLQSKTMFITMRVAIVVAVLAATRLLGFEVPEIVTIGVGMVGSLAGGWMVVNEVWNQLAHGERYSPGAHDNASGVGVVLALAEHFSSEPPDRLRLGFLFTGAEETGLHGATAFAAIVSDLFSAKNAKLMVLSFDMVGAGNTLRFITRDGTLFPQHTDTQLNALVQAAHPEARGLWYTLRSGDFVPFLRRGIPATALQTSGSAKAELAYHTVHDTLQVVEVPTLEMTASVAFEFVRRLDAGEQAFRGVVK